MRALDAEAKPRLLAYHHLGDFSVLFQQHRPYGPEAFNYGEAHFSTRRIKTRAT